MRLSLRDDGDGYIGDIADWDRAETELENMAGEFGLDYVVARGEAAMYGPKMDFMATDALGREWQLATVQLDYALPERFDLEYTNDDGQKKSPVMVHSALLGSLERFMAVFIEHTAGWLPFWCAPEQVRVLTVNDAVEDYVGKIEEVLGGVVLEKPLRYNELRYSVDRRNESLGRKIREAVGMKIPVVLIVGPKDVEAGEVSVRLKEKEEKVALDKLADYLHSL